MNVGWIGLGKLGLPCALALSHHGDRRIVGYDTRVEDVARVLAGQQPPPLEANLPKLILLNRRLTCARGIDEVIDATDELVFVAVQTPHHPDYGGETIVPVEPRDFDYAHLEHAVRSIVRCADDRDKNVTIVVVSTVLPGTLRGRIWPLLTPRTRLVYNPLFIAMGTTIDDFLRPEFVLIGEKRPGDADRLVELYRDLLGDDVPICVLDVESAELTKVAYNTFISLKIVFANTLMEICEKIGADVDQVVDVISLATKRVISPAYMRGGMGDGGACHPRDNVAMSWLAGQLDLGADPFKFVTRAREGQCAWLAREVQETADANGLPIVVLGKSYKPESDLTLGSPAALLVHLLGAGGNVRWYDPYVDGADVVPPGERAVYVIATRHECLRDYPFPVGSVVIDPHRLVNVPDGVRLIGLGGRR